MSKLPALSGQELARLLERDGWIYRGTSRHGRSYAKRVRGEWRVTVIPMNPGSLPKGTLHAILSEKQTGLGRRGLRRLLNKYGR